MPPRRVENGAEHAISTELLRPRPPRPEPPASAMINSPHTGSPLVVLEDVHLTLGSAAGPVNVLRGVSLAIDAGEAVALVGPSGSGKSSLMMVLAGLERPSVGQVRVAGEIL